MIWMGYPSKNHMNGKESCAWHVYSRENKWNNNKYRNGKNQVNNKSALRPVTLVPLIKNTQGKYFSSKSRTGRNDEFCSEYLCWIKKAEYTRMDSELYGNMDTL